MGIVTPTLIELLVFHAVLEMTHVGALRDKGQGGELSESSISRVENKLWVPGSLERATWMSSFLALHDSQTKRMQCRQALERHKEAKH